MNTELFDAVVVGGGPAGATAADRLAKEGRSVLLLDRAGRIKPCGGAVPPRLIRDFEIPASQICAQIKSARMVSPRERTVDMPIGDGYVGMVDREVFDEFLRARAASSGAERRVGVFEQIRRDDQGSPHVQYRTPDGELAEVQTKLVIGADGALSKVARQELVAERRAEAHPLPSWTTRLSALTPSISAACFTLPPHRSSAWATRKAWARSVASCTSTASGAAPRRATS